MSLRALCAALSFSCSLLLGLAASAEELKIYLKTTPALEFLRPFADPVTMSLLITRADGRPLEQGSVGIVLDAPKSGAFLSTDFPVVENSRLLELALPLRQGRAGWKYLFPIRGDYRLSVNVVGSDGTKTVKYFVIPVLEDRTKWLSLGLFCAALFILGFTAGRIFTAAPATITMAWLIFICQVTMVSGHDGPVSVQNLVTPSSALEIAAATVGKPTQLRWRAPDGAAASTLLSISITHLEKHKTVFAVDNVPVDKDYLFDFQFPDGAEYRVNSIAQFPDRGPLRTEQLVAVTGIEPPMAAQVPALALFLAVIALGLGAGRFSKILAAR